MLRFVDMKILSKRNGGDWVNNESEGLVVYHINAIPEFHNMPCTEPYKRYPTYPRFVVEYRVTRESCLML